MPFLDRYWWLRPVLAAAGLFVIGAPLAQVAYDEGIFQSIAQGHIPSLSDILHTGSFVISVSVAALVFAMSAIAARWRNFRRMAAIDGNLDRIPQADIPGAENSLPLEPIIIQRQLSKRLRWVYLPALTPLLFVFLVLFVWGECYLTAEVASRWGAGEFSAVEFLQLIFRIHFALLCVCSVIMYVRYVPTALGKPFGAVLNADGVSSRGGLGGTTSLRWEEIRLFEVSAPTFFGHALYPYTYRLCGTRRMVEWEEDPRSNDSPPTASSTLDGTAIAVTAIRERTGLPPRTFVKALQAEKPPHTVSQEA